MAKKEKLESSFIKTAEYDEASKELTLSFKGRPVTSCKYFGVSGRTYKAFQAAESKGSFFNSKIKGKFAEEVVS